MRTAEYWRAVHRRALTEAAKTLHLESWVHVMISMAGIVVAIFALAYWGSSDASRDEMIARAAIGGTIIGLFPLVYVWKLINAPAMLDAEAAAEIATVRNQRDSLQTAVSETRCVLSISRPQCVNIYGNKRWRIVVFNSGPAVAIGTQMKLVDIIPAPKQDPWVKDSCPHKVIVVGLTFDAPDPRISVGQSETFEPLMIYAGAANAVVVGNIDPEHHGQPMAMEIGERWRLEYRVFAENSSAIDFSLTIHRHDEETVTVEDDYAH